MNRHGYANLNTKRRIYFMAETLYEDKMSRIDLFSDSKHYPKGDRMSTISFKIKC